VVDLTDYLVERTHLWHELKGVVLHRGNTENGITRFWCSSTGNK
jgi:hypothetical protein